MIKDISHIIHDPWLTLNDISVILGWFDWTKSVLMKLTNTTTWLYKWDMFDWQFEIKTKPKKKNWEKVASGYRVQTKPNKSKQHKAWMCSSLWTELYGLKKPTEDWKCKNMSDWILLSCLLFAGCTTNPNRSVKALPLYQGISISRVCMYTCTECMRVFS